MNQTIILQAIECPVTGGIGLAPQAAINGNGSEDYMADTDGVLLAHDLLEHINGPEHIGGIGDELEALGAIWYGRGQSNDMSRENRASMFTPEQNIGSDVSRMAQDFTYKGFERAVPEQQETDADESLRYIIAYAMREARNEYSDEYNDSTTGTRAAFREYAANSLAFMQAGYHKAEAKYGTSYALSNLFWNVRDAVKPYSASADFVGRLYELTINDDGEAFCDEYYETDDSELACDDCAQWFDDEGTHTENQNGYIQCAECIEKEQAA